MSGSIAVSAFNGFTRPELMSLLETQDVAASSLLQTQDAGASICDSQFHAVHYSTSQTTENMPNGTRL